MVLAVFGNIQDMSTLMDEIEVAKTSVGVSIDDLDLDAGYITMELITAYNADGRFVSFTGRTPARRASLSGLSTTDAEDPYIR